MRCPILRIAAGSRLFRPQVPTLTEKVLNCEVAVVGGGPAGSTCAESLAQQGIDVVLLERYPMPRRKVCAGGLTAAALNLLPEEVQPIIECRLRTLRVTSLGGRRVEFGAVSTLVVTAYREQLDWLLWRRAVDAGAMAIDGSRVMAIERNRTSVLLRGEGFSVVARYLVGADGANGVVGQGCGFGRSEHVATGMMVEVPRPDSAPAGAHEAVELVGGLGDGTFGWVFPRRETLSIGVEWHQRRTDIAHALERVVAHAGATLPEGTPRLSHPIPSIPHDGKVIDGRVVLIGDAGGMCDPLTGEGVRNAVLAGRNAADALSNACRGEDYSLADYQAWFERELLPELKAGMTLLGLALRFETPGLLALQHQERARRACMSLLRGQTSYTSILRGAESFGGLLSLLMGKCE